MIAHSFFNQIVVLNRNDHRAMKVKLPGKDYRFSAASMTVPVVLSEFFDLAVDFPILLASDGNGQLSPMALLGLKAGQNVFVEAAGQWTAAYVPAAVRAHPFGIVESETEKGLWFSVIEKSCLDEEEGAALFDDKGESAPDLLRANSLSMAFETDRAKTAAFVAHLQELKLIKETTLQLVPESAEPVSINGCHVIDEAAFGALPAEAVESLHAKGHLGACYALLLSLRNVQKLLKKSLALP